MSMKFIMLIHEKMPTLAFEHLSAGYKQHLRKKYRYSSAVFDQLKHHAQLS